MTETATPFRRTPDVIAKLESDRARLIEFARVVMLWYENAGNADPDQKSAGSLQLWVQARSLLRELEEPQ